MRSVASEVSCEFFSGRLGRDKDEHCPLREGVDVRVPRHGRLFSLGECTCTAGGACLRKWGIRCDSHAHLKDAFCSTSTT